MTQSSSRPNLHTLLQFDAVEAAETVAGRSVHSGDDVARLALGMQMVHGAVIKQALDDADDTSMSNTLENYTRIVKDLGFELAASFAFTSPGWTPIDPPQSEQYFIYAHLTKGILLEFDTYCGDRVNGGHFYYAWRPHNGFERSLHGVTSSGGVESVLHPHWRREERPDNALPEDAFWFGHHDCRQALRHHIAQLDAHGSFLPCWPAHLNGGRKGHGVFLTHHQDWKDPRYTQGNREQKDAFLAEIYTQRTAALPEAVRRLMGLI